jgi:hypothetical protein
MPSPPKHRGGPAVLAQQNPISTVQEDAFGQHGALQLPADPPEGGLVWAHPMRDRARVLGNEGAWSSLAVT